MTSVTHQYVDRLTGELRTERLFSDRRIQLIYSVARERMPGLFRALVGRNATRLMGYLSYDFSLGAKVGGSKRFLTDLGVDLGECVDPIDSFTTTRAVFERKIRYWDTRPMPEDPDVVVSPADARVLVGSMKETGRLFIKEKFFRFDELIDRPHPVDGGIDWRETFEGGDFAVFRLTPDKYHYNHTPVSGRVVDFFEIDGVYHSCNPNAVVSVVTPYSKNRRVVTVIDTDVPGGTRVGHVAMIEVVAMMIGQVVQCYSDNAYEDPSPVEPGMFVRRGQVKSLYRPGSSTDVLVFEPGRVQFDQDLVSNLSRDASSRFTRGFEQPLVETDVAVRSSIARRVKCTSAPGQESQPPQRVLFEA